MNYFPWSLFRRLVNSEFVSTSRFNASDGFYSFIHSGYLYSAPSRNLLRGAPSPATVKEKCLKKLLALDGAQREVSLPIKVVIRFAKVVLWSCGEHFQGSIMWVIPAQLNQF